MALTFLIIGIISATIILLDILSGHRQRMMIMNVVWPVTGLYAGPLALIAYYSLGRKAAKRKSNQEPHRDKGIQKKPFWQSVIVSTLHCGSGCTLGDLTAETLLIFFPIVIFGNRLYDSWIIDFIFAFGFGIIFQYYSIKPMKKLPAGKALAAALKADAFSLTAWQIGMYGAMAISDFFIFKYTLEPTERMFWFVMQPAMICGFITSYPVNWWLLKKGIKETM